MSKIYYIRCKKHTENKYPKIWHTANGKIFFKLIEKDVTVKKYIYQKPRTLRFFKWTSINC